jgi:hypothetical protein
MRVGVRHLAMGVALGGLLTAPLVGGAAASADGRPGASPSASPSARLVPSAVAVANDGSLAAAGWLDANSVDFLLERGPRVSADLGCRPVDVSMAPDASSAWAVCHGDPHIHVIDVDTGDVSRAGIDMIDADDIVYLPQVDQLVVADLEGEIVVLSLPDYAVIKRIATPGFRPTVLAPLPDGRGTHAAGDAGALIYVDLVKGTVKDLITQGGGTQVKSLSLSRTGTRLYAGAVLGPSGGAQRSAVVALDPATGRVLQEVPLDFTIPGFTTINVATGHRSLTVGTGLGILIDGEITGALTIALDATGRLGSVTSLSSPYTFYVADVSRSGNGSFAVVATTSATVSGSFDVDTPYPPQVSVKGSLRGTMVSLSGVTGGIRPGARLTVYVRDLTQKKSRFIKQGTKAVVTSVGGYRWKGKAPSKRMAVYVAGDGVPSATITVTGRQ